MYYCKECGVSVTNIRGRDQKGLITRDSATITKDSGIPACGVCLAFIVNLIGGEAWPTGSHPNWTETEKDADDLGFGDDDPVILGRLESLEVDDRGHVEMNFKTEHHPSSPEKTEQTSQPVGHIDRYSEIEKPISFRLLNEKHHPSSPGTTATCVICEQLWPCQTYRDGE